MSWSTDLMQRLRRLGFVATADDKWEARVGSLRVVASFNEDGDFFLGSNRDDVLRACNKTSSAAPRVVASGSITKHFSTTR